MTEEKPEMKISVEALASFLVELERQGLIKIDRKRLKIP
jgi:hypothetical protein